MRKDAIYQKAAHYCSYQERTEKEMQDKLYAWGVDDQEEIARIIQVLKTNRFLDEERYVATFIRGKYLGRQWGKRKLWAVLMKKAISPVLIQKGLEALETDTYLQSLRHIATRKQLLLTGTTLTQKKQQLTNFLLQKGYEPDLVHQVVQETLIR